MPTSQLAELTSRKRLLAHFRNEAGAFDLPSILVGVVVVGILTAGVLAAIFGVIPFAQDKAAQQDLDATRTAEGVAKARDGKYLPSDGLRTANLLNGPESSVADTDASGSCYVGIARSGSGNLFYSSSAASGAQVLTSATNTGCITAGQRDAMITAVGGTPVAAAPPGVTYTPVPVRAGVTSNLAARMNAELYNWYASPLMLAAAEIDAVGGDSTAAWAAWEDAENAPYAAALAVLTAEERNQFDNIVDRSAVSELKAAAMDAEDVFWANPTISTQQALLDAWANVYDSGIPLPGAHLVAAPSDPAAFNDVTIQVGSSAMVTFKAAMPAGVDVTDASSITSAGTLSGALAYDNGTPYWRANVTPEFTPTVGTYKFHVAMKDPATNIKYFKEFTITVTP